MMEKSKRRDKKAKHVAANSDSSGNAPSRVLSSLNDVKGNNLANLSRELKELSASIRNNKKGEKKAEITPKPIEKTLNTIKSAPTDNREEVIFEYSGGDYFSIEQIEGQNGENSEIEEIIAAIKEVQQSKLNISATDMLQADPPPQTENTDEELDENYYTESLAHIYIKQKKYLRALEIIRYLSLKFPKKNIYFADQIRFLEKLIINIKN